MAYKLSSASGRPIHVLCDHLPSRLCQMSAIYFTNAYIAQWPHYINGLAPCGEIEDLALLPFGDPTA